MKKSVPALVLAMIAPPDVKAEEVAGVDETPAMLRLYGGRSRYLLSEIHKLAI